jgi:putative glutathione S-transferase
MVRSLKGLKDCIDVTTVHPVWQKTREDPDDPHCGWIFGDPNGEPLTNTIGLGGPFPAQFPGSEPDPNLGVKFVRDIYEYCEDTVGTYSVPILWDKKLKTIVSNESSEIIRMLNSEFNDFATNPELDLYPEEHRLAIDDINGYVYQNINNGVYRCGFSKSQPAYDEAVGKLTAAFDRVDEILKEQRFIAGDVFTEADIRLFVTLVRFDEVYAVYFKTNTRSVTYTPAILNYCREIYQMPGVAETVDMEQIKWHYYTSHPTYNHFSVVPAGANFLERLKEPHGEV